jgi:hypothetical protein
MVVAATEKVVAARKRGVGTRGVSWRRERGEWERGEWWRRREWLVNEGGCGDEEAGGSGNNGGGGSEREDQRCLTSLIFVRRYPGIIQLVRKPGPSWCLSSTLSSSMTGRA